MNTTSWEMFTPEGEQAVTEVMNTVNELVQIGRIDEAIQALADGYQRVGKSHSEIGDTAVREAVCYELEQMFKVKYGGDCEAIVSRFMEAMF